MLRTLFSYFKPHMKLFTIDMFCAIMVSAVDLAFPMLSRHAMYDLLPDHMYSFFFRLMLLIAVFYLLRSACYYLMVYVGHTFGIHVETDIRRDLFRHIQSLDFDFFDGNRTGQLMSRLTGDLFEITELAHHGPEDLVISFLTLVGALIFMFIIEWKLALVVAVLIPVFIVIIMHERQSMVTSSRAVKAKLADISTDIETCISGIRTSKAFANEDVDFGRFDSSNKRYRQTKRGYYRAMGRFMAAQEFFMGLMPVIVIAFGGWLIMLGELNYIDLVTFTLFVTTFITPVRKMTQFSEIFVTGLAGLERFSALMALEPSVKELPGAVSLEVTDGQIDIDHVFFSYNERREVLEDVSLNIRGGETIAVVGQSGGGKTTLCQLIPRFYEVASGSISIDGTDIRHVTKESLRQSIGIVQQDVFIFADTILENIRYGRPQATLEEVEEAAKHAEIYDDIMAMPDGFDTFVGERGTKLSGGQKQRISIARILLKDPKILILDEATSSLDTVTEARIQRSFDELSRGRTSIIIAHRLATVRNADRIVLIEGGRILEEGTHEELLALNGSYAKLYHTQMLG
jgi:ATP-binding cassette subfamily B protein